MPTLIIVESHIGYGAPHKQDTRAAYGEPLGEEEIHLAKRSYGWPEEAQFLVRDGLRKHFQDGIGRRGASLQKIGKRCLNPKKKIPELADGIERISGASFPIAGTRLFRFLRPTGRAMPRVTPPARCSMPLLPITLG